MKPIFLSIALMGCLGPWSVEAKAQMYWPYAHPPYGYGAPYQPYPYPQYYDPYYDLHVMHYQLYLQQYAGYPIYQPCCFVAGGARVWSAPTITQPKGTAPRPRPFRRR
jgi:hypothetical protein